MGFVDYNLSEMANDPFGVETFDMITIPHSKGAMKIATKSTRAIEKPKFEIESREENGLQIFKLVDKSSLKYTEKILKQYYEHVERTRRDPDYIYINMNTLKYVAQEVKPYDFVPSPNHSLSDSTLYGMKIRLSESVPDGQVYLIREEPWL